MTHSALNERSLQYLQASISRRDWFSTELAANQIRDEIEETRRILAGTDIGSLPTDYPLASMAEDIASLKISKNSTYGKIGKEDIRYDTPTMAPDHIEPYTHGWLTGFMTGCIGTCVTLGALWVLL